MSTSITILSYNTHIFKDSIIETGASFLKFFGGNTKTILCKDNERMLDITNRLKTVANGRLDVIALTEVWAHLKQQKFIQSFGPEFKSFAFQNEPDLKASAGMVLGVRGEIQPPPMSFDYYKAEDMTGADAMSSKGVTYGRVTVCGKKIYIIQTHTQASYVDSEKIDEAARKKTITETLFKIIDEALESFNGPIFLLGDLNIKGGSEEYNWFSKQLLGRGFDDTWTSISPSNSGITYDPEANSLVKYFDPKETEKQRLDYIFYRKDKASAKSMHVLTDWKTSTGIDDSDHYPVIATFTV